MDYKTIKIDSFADIPKKGAYHVIYSSGAESWLVDGKLHREDAPAVIYPDGSVRWFLNDVHCTINTPPHKVKQDTSIPQEKIPIYINGKKLDNSHIS